MFDFSWGFVGVTVNGEFVNGSAPIHEIRGMEGFKVLQDAYSKKTHAFDRIICCTASGQERYLACEDLGNVSLSDGIPVISFLCPDRFEAVYLVGWGNSNL